MTVRIPLHSRSGIVGWTTVDDVDADLAEHRWFAASGASRVSGAPGYAARGVTVDGKRKHLRMNRVILERMGFTDFPMGDHIDRNPLNNRRSNLRPATAKLNAQNYTPGSKPGRPPVRPVPSARPCRRCGTMFVPPRSRPDARWCSTACHRVPVVERSCEECGSSFIPKQPRSTRVQRTCSARCRNAANSQFKRRPGALVLTYAEDLT